MLFLHVDIVAFRLSSIMGIYMLLSLKFLYFANCTTPIAFKKIAMIVKLAQKYYDIDRDQMAKNTRIYASPFRKLMWWDDYIIKWHQWLYNDK